MIVNFYSNNFWINVLVRLLTIKIYLREVLIKIIFVKQIAFNGKNFSKTCERNGQNKALFTFVFLIE
jgi:hypothetical protein